MTTGWIYVLSNPCLTCYKIGSTKNNPDIRAKNLSTTGLPEPFVVEIAILTKDYVKKEFLIHKILDDYRRASNREFFDIKLNKIIEIFNLIDKKSVKIKCVKDKKSKKLPNTNKIKDKDEDKKSKKLPNTNKIRDKDKKSKKSSNTNKIKDKDKKSKKSSNTNKIKRTSIIKKLMSNITKPRVIKKPPKKSEKNTKSFNFTKFNVSYNQGDLINYNIISKGIPNTKILYYDKILNNTDYVILYYPKNNTYKKEGFYGIYKITRIESVSSLRQYKTKKFIINTPKSKIPKLIKQGKFTLVDPIVSKEYFKQDNTEYLIYLQCITKKQLNFPKPVFKNCRINTIKDIKNVKYLTKIIK